MKKFMISLAALVTGLGGYWLWRHRDQVQATVHQRGLDDQLRGKAMQLKGTLTDDPKAKVKGDLVAGRGDFKDWLVAVRCDSKQ